MARPTNAGPGPVRQRLIAAREARGLDRAQAAAGAGISLRYLVMLEEGEYPLVSDPAYLSPFIRRYAAFLDLPPEPTVVAFLSETEVAERVAAASVSLPPSVPEDEPERRFRPVLIAAMVVAVAGGAAAALVDLPMARRWLDRFRPTVESFGGIVDRAAASVGRIVAETRSTVGAWIASDSPAPPVEVASSSPEAPSENAATAAPEDRLAAVELSALVATAAPLATATAPPPATPVLLSDARLPAAPTPAAAHRPERNRLELLATARQVFVWATIDGREPREVELRRGETASFEARRELLLTIDDAGGVLATLNGKRLPPLGAPGYGKRNIRIPLRAAESGEGPADR